jgi:hypothetical protein
MLQNGKVLLHALPVLGHHLRSHSTTLSLLSGLLLTSIVLALVAVSTGAVASALIVVLTQVATGLCLLDLNWLAQNLKRTGESLLNSSITVKSNETKSAGTSSVLVHHKSSIHNTAELHKELLKVLLGSLLANTTNENL